MNNRETDNSSPLDWSYTTGAHPHQTYGSVRKRKIDPALREWLDLLIPTMVQQYIATGGGSENSDVNPIQELVQ